MKYHRLLVAIALVAVSAVVASVPIRCPLDDEGVQSAKAGAATEDPGFAGFREGRMELPTTQNPALLPKARLMKEESHDLNQDGISEYYALADGVLRVTCGHRLLWRTPDNWWVDYYFVGDSDNNGVAELNLLVWKEGSFGPNRPFWVTEEDRSVKNHLFILTLEDHVMRPVWQSSNLDNPNYWATLMDLDDDGAQELVVVEGSYTNPLVEQVTVWQWNGWGFSRAKGLEEEASQLPIWDMRKRDLFKLDTSCVQL